MIYTTDAPVNYTLETVVDGIPHWELSFEDGSFFRSLKSVVFSYSSMAKKQKLKCTQVNQARWFIRYCFTSLITLKKWLDIH
jgi:hypothetical protein